MTIKSSSGDERRIRKLAQALARRVEAGDLGAFERELRAQASPALLLAIRRNKTLARGTGTARQAAAEAIVATASRQLPPEEAAEFARYVRLSLEVSAARELVKARMLEAIARLPKLSLRQLLQVAERVARDAGPAPVPPVADTDVAQLAAEYGRRMHELSGSTNDLWFAIARVVNEAAARIGGRDLDRPGVRARAVGPFRTAMALASQLNGLDYVLDCASFGEFVVSAHHPDRRAFKLDVADVRGTLIRVLAIRRKLMAMVSGRREERYLRQGLREAGEVILDDSLLKYSSRMDGAGTFEGRDLERMRNLLRLLLLHVDAEDDLLCAATAEPRRTALLYHASMALRLISGVARTASSRLAGRAGREFEDGVRLADLIDGFGAEAHESVEQAWLDLTVELPARGHFELIRRPFIRSAPGVARSLIGFAADTWPVIVREIINHGGETGRRYGALWEDYYARSFEDTGWRTLARNVHVNSGGQALTEVDLLLLRDDLLLVVEVKAMTGSGMNAYDHWKNRDDIERGCRQAKLAAEHLDANRGLIVSIAGRKVADRIRHVQPLVLTTENMFDGWEHAGVPVAGETIRKAITVGTKVDYHQTGTEGVVRTDWHLRPEDLSTVTILKALRDPIELKLAPETGEVRHLTVEIEGLRLLVPETGLQDELANASTA